MYTDGHLITERNAIAGSRWIGRPLVFGRTLLLTDQSMLVCLIVSLRVYSHGKKDYGEMVTLFELVDHRSREEHTHYC